MREIFDDLSEKKKTGKLSGVSARVFQAINTKWPINTLEAAEILEDDGKAKTLSAKYVYHFKKLNEKGLIRMKKMGNTYVAWPSDIEKLRVINELIRG